MDRPTTRTEAVARDSRLDAVEAPVLPSRRIAENLCRSALMGLGADLGATAGPVLITGDAGVGKTWLWRRLEAKSPTGLRWIAVDLTPSDEPVDFYRLIGHELGLIDPVRSHSTTTRVALVDQLSSRLADGERINLVVEEAHNLSSDLWEEVRVLANRLGRPGGFASMFLVGQTSLALRFSTRPFAAIEARLVARVHLGPIGVDEARDLLHQFQPSRDWHPDEVERLHRDASGNPRRLLRLAVPKCDFLPKLGNAPAVEEKRMVSQSRSILGPDQTDLVPEKPVEATEANPRSMPLTGPARPPIQADENMIEVGWAPDDASPSDGQVQESRLKVEVSDRPDGGEEAVQDHYAALQAWREWSENQARQATRPPDLADDSSEELDYEDEEEELETLPPARIDRPVVRVEGEQKFAPFGQLFSRMAQAREPE